MFEVINYVLRLIFTYLLTKSVVDWWPFKLQSKWDKQSRRASANRLKASIRATLRNVMSLAWT